MLFDHIRSEVIEKERIVRLSEMTEFLLEYLSLMEVKECKTSTKKHIRRNIESEFGELIKFESLLENKSMFLVPVNMKPVQTAKDILAILMSGKECNSSKEIIQKAALEVREVIRKKENKTSWPPRPSDLNEAL